VVQWESVKDLTDAVVIEKIPPLCGCLKLVYNFSTLDWLDLSHELPNRINFQSVELEGCYGDGVLPIL
jgi:hypothetical protein